MDIQAAKNTRSGIDIRAIVIKKGDPRTVNLKAGGTSDVCEVTISDDTGEMPLTLWNEDIDRVSVGDTIEISNGYTSEFKGTSQLNIGKYGKMSLGGTS